MDELKCTELLDQHHIKPTANRILVVKSLAVANRPMSLSELENKILTIDKSGIFRALTLFKEHHLVHVIEDGGDGVRYELCMSRHIDEDDDMHVHFYCEQCHETFCMEGIAIPHVDLPAGYRMHTANFVIKGKCPACGGRAD